MLKLAGGASLGLVLFGAWVLLPFALAATGVATAPAATRRAIGITLASGFGLVMYGELLLAQDLSSTAGLAFMFIPLWQVLGVLVILAVTRRRAKAPERAG
jgi:hypothetical protein